MKPAQATINISTSETRMDLILWRHAEAEDGTPDLKRKLTARGEKQAKQMAEWIKAHAPKNLRIIVSPAVRTQQTAKALDLPFSTDKRLGPEASVADLLAVANWPSDTTQGSDTAILAIGHQPTLGRTAALLLSGEDAYWTIKKGAVWWFSSRTRQGEMQTVLRMALPPEFGQKQ
jgi:phosphohistidine phosphatase